MKLNELQFCLKTYSDIYISLITFCLSFIFLSQIICCWGFFKGERKDTFFCFCISTSFDEFRKIVVSLLCVLLVAVLLPSHMLQLVNMLHLRQKKSCLFALIRVSHLLRAMGLFLLINSFLHPPPPISLCCKFVIVVCQI